MFSMMKSKRLLATLCSWVLLNVGCVTEAFAQSSPSPSPAQPLSCGATPNVQNGLWQVYGPFYGAASGSQLNIRIRVFPDIPEAQSYLALLMQTIEMAQAATQSPGSSATSSLLNPQLPGQLGQYATDLNPITGTTSVSNGWWSCSLPAGSYLMLATSNVVQTGCNPFVAGTPPCTLTIMYYEGLLTVPPVPANPPSLLQLMIPTSAWGTPVVTIQMSSAT